MTFLDQFISWAHSSLMESDEAQSYLLGRGVSRDQWVNHQLGFTSGEFDADSSTHPGHNQVCSDYDSKHKWCDACRYRHWSSIWEIDESIDKDRKTQKIGKRIQNCIVFPLRSYSGSLVGFQVRSIDQKNYDSFLISRRPEGYFFGSPKNFLEIWATKEVIIVEGPGDHLITERLVAPNVLGLTTSGPSQHQLQYLKRFVKKVIMCLDMDAAGRKGVRTLMSRSDLPFEVSDVRYPQVREGDKDPGDFWKRVGDQLFSKHFNNEMRKIK